MNRATPKMRSLAKHLMVYEALGEKKAKAKNPATFHVTDKLRPHLTTLMGTGGFRALLSRSLALSNQEVAWLRAVHVKADGSLEGLEALHTQLAPAEFLEGRVVLLAHLLGLLVAFIGENLTSRVVSEIWPQISLEDLDFDNGDKNEKTN